MGEYQRPTLFSDTHIETKLFLSWELHFKELRLRVQKYISCRLPLYKSTATSGLLVLVHSSCLELIICHVQSCCTTCLRERWLITSQITWRTLTSLNWTERQLQRHTCMLQTYMKMNVYYFTHVLRHLYANLITSLECLLRHPSVSKVVIETTFKAPVNKYNAMCFYLFFSFIFYVSVTI